VNDEIPAAAAAAAAAATVGREVEGDDDLDGFDDFEDHGEPIKLKCDDLEKMLLTPQTPQIKLQLPQHRILGLSW
jgi:hypothetical protein